MDGEPPVEPEYTVEVEEAELSSADERGHSNQTHDSAPLQFDADRRTHRASSPVQDDDDDDVIIDEEDDEEEDVRSRVPPSSNGTRPADAEFSSRSSGGDSRDGSSGDDVPRTAERTDGKISSAYYSDDELASDAGPEDRRPRRKTHTDADSDYNQSDDAGASDDDSEDASDDEAKEKGSTRPPQQSARLVIPDNMRGNNEYFRRSNRTRQRPSRLAGSPGASNSSDDGGKGDSDSEYEAFDDPDDEDYGFSKRKPKRARPARQTESAPHTAYNGSRAQEPESSESDVDWTGDNVSRRAGGRSRRRRQPRKRQRIVASDESDGARTGRVNVRTGQTINYAEMEGSDSDLYDSDDAAAARAAKEPVDDSNVEAVELVVDFRSTNEHESETRKVHSLIDFYAESIEVYIKWIGKSYRKNTWHSIEELKAFKGIKRVLNYVKRFSERRDALNDPSTSLEEREESLILAEEHRKNYATYLTVERVIAQRPFADDPTESEYLVKWNNLSYEECTWELSAELQSDEDVKALDAFAEREQAAAAATTKKRLNPFNTKLERPRFTRMKEQPSYLHGEGRRLREYQLAGLNWLAFSWTKRRNVILADEMGLGKTLQTISFLGWLMYERSVPGPFLVVVPLSTSAAWVREFARWLPDMNVIRYCGNGRARETIRQHEFWPSNGARSFPKFHVLLTTPELVMSDEKFIAEIRWAAIAVDEAHRLKNEAGALHQTLKELRSANRLLVTGTPLQNSVKELWALLNFLNPDVFPDPLDFEEKFSFSALRDPENVAQLHNTLRPYIIRRQKTDVEKSLPKKSYAVLRVGMSSTQQQYYELLYTRNFARLNAVGKGKGMGNQLSLRNLVMELKKCCNHPFLFPQFYSHEADSNLQAYIRGSGKMILLDKLLLRLREKGHRVLIFSQMVSMLEILQEYCRMRGFPHQRLDGSMPNDIRQRAIDHYNEPGSTDYVFLLSTRAGGLGINLATADTVIIFDSDWNPQNDLQAESRAHRIGQTKDVKVFRLLTRKSVEEDILERAKRKRVLEHLVIHGVEGDEKQAGKDGSKGMTFKKEELSAILRFGAEELFSKDKVGTKTEGLENGAPGQEVAPDDDKAEEKRVLAVDDIDELLARAPVEESDELGASEPSLGDSLLNAFKWADFEAIEEDEKDESANVPDDAMLATSAARAVSKLEDKKERDLNKARKQDQDEKEMLAKEGDAEFWDRVIPDEAKIEAETVVLGTRRRKTTNPYGSEPTSDRKRRRTTRSRNSRGALGELSDKEQRALLKSFRRFGDPRRTMDILKDAGLESRIELEDAKGMLEEAVAKARSLLSDEHENGNNYGANGSAANGKDRKSKGPAITIEMLGESSVDVYDLVKRCDDLQRLRRLIARCETDTRFRLQRTPKAPTYGVRWMPQQDALLLVGVNRHGFGNWAKIAEDSELQLGDKIFVPGRPNNKKGAPDSTKLQRRVLTLLKELELDAKPPPKSRARDRTKAKEKASTQKRSNPDRTKRRRDEVEPAERMDRERGRSSKSRNSKKRKVAKTRDSRAGGSSFDNMKGQLITALRATHSSTLRELKHLSTEDSKMDKSEKIARTKQCLLKLGRTIEKQSSSNKMRVELWNYVHDDCCTNLPGERLSAIYDKLKESA